MMKQIKNKNFIALTLSLLLFSCGLMEKDKLPEPKDDPALHGSPNDTNDALPGSAIALELGSTEEISGLLRPDSNLPTPYRFAISATYKFTMPNPGKISIEADVIHATECSENSEITKFYFHLIDRFGNVLSNDDLVYDGDELVTDDFPGYLTAGSYQLLVIAYGSESCRISSNFSVSEPIYETPFPNDRDQNSINDWQLEVFENSIAIRRHLAIDTNYNFSWREYHDGQKVESISGSIAFDMTSRPMRALLTITGVHETNSSPAPAIGDKFYCIYFIEYPENPEFFTLQCNSDENTGFPDQFGNDRQTYRRVGSSSEVPEFWIDKESRPELNIPDNDIFGVKQHFDIETTGTRIVDIGITVGIRHRARGDLVVNLVHPDGTRIVLHNRSGGFDDNLEKTYGYSGTAYAPLDALVGKEVNGRWTIEVKDERLFNTGNFAYVRLQIGARR